MSNIEKYFKTKDKSHFKEVYQLASTQALDDWKDYFWAGMYLNEYAPDGTYNELIAKTIEKSFIKGLTYQSDSDCYLAAIRMIGKLYLELQQYDLALNNLHMLILRDSDLPDWVHLRYAYAQLHYDITANLFLDNPQLLFNRLEMIRSNDVHVIEQRNTIFQEFLEICTEKYKSQQIMTINNELILEKAAEYKILHTDSWRQFAELFPQEFGNQSNINMITQIQTVDETENFSESLVNELEQENKKLIEDIRKLQSQMLKLLNQNKNYEDLLKEKNDIINKLTLNDACIDNIKRKTAKGITKGHDLLVGNKKILVIGQPDVGTDKLLGIVKDFGYNKDDFVFWDDYAKIKSYAERMAGGSFTGIIAGPMPHKVSKLGDNSSLIDKMRQNGYPYMEEAKSESGELKITKTSFRKALEGLTKHLLAIQ